MKFARGERPLESAAAFFPSARGVLLALTAAAVASLPSGGTGDSYLTNAEVTARMEDLALDREGATSLMELGASAAGTRIVAAKVSSGSKPAPPAVLMVANIHGDEIVGREMMMRLIELLASGCKHDPVIKRIVSSEDVYVIPSLNPDGFERGTRFNLNGVDLNRNFPDPWFPPDPDVWRPEPETAALMNLTQSVRFVLGAGVHGGSIAVNYPFDGNPERRSGLYSATGDDDLFRMVATEYAANSAALRNGGRFPGGITNGARWYVLYGGMQDWSYAFEGVIGTTLEISADKSPPYREIDLHWERHAAALLAYLMIPLWCGIDGTVVDAATGLPLDAVVLTSSPCSAAVRTDPPTGRYRRLLAPGRHTVWSEAGGYHPSEPVEVLVEDGQTEPRRTDFEMTRADGRSADGTQRHGRSVRCPRRMLRWKDPTGPENGTVETGIRRNAPTADGFPRGAV